VHRVERHEVVRERREVPTDRDARPRGRREHDGGRARAHAGESERADHRVDAGVIDLRERAVATPREHDRPERRDGVVDAARGEPLEPQHRH